MDITEDILYQNRQNPNIGFSSPIELGNQPIQEGFGTDYLNNLGFTPESIFGGQQQSAISSLSLYDPSKMIDLNTGQANGDLNLLGTTNPLGNSDFNIADTEKFIKDFGTNKPGFFDKGGFFGKEGFTMNSLADIGSFGKSLFDVYAGIQDANRADKQFEFGKNLAITQQNNNVALAQERLNTRRNARNSDGRGQFASATPQLSAFGKKERTV